MSLHSASPAGAESMVGPGPKPAGSVTLSDSHGLGEHLPSLGVGTGSMLTWTAAVHIWQICPVGSSNASSLFRAVGTRCLVCGMISSVLRPPWISGASAGASTPAQMGLIEALEYEVPEPNAAQRAMWHVSSSRPGAWLFAKSGPHLDRFLLRLSNGQVTLATLVAGHSCHHHRYDRRAHRADPCDAIAGRSLRRRPCRYRDPLRAKGHARVVLQSPGRPGDPGCLPGQKHGGCRPRGARRRVAGNLGASPPDLWRL
jgi:hypothetical protein